MVALETMAAVQEGEGFDWSVLGTIEWIDWTAIVILSVFFILGLFRGFVWQATRIVSLVAGYVVAGIFGEDGAELIQRMNPEWSANGIPLYLSYVTIFLGVVALLSVIAHYVQKLVKKTGLSFYDRIGGGFLGIATGGLVTIAILGMTMMFLPADWAPAQAAERSKAMQLSKRTLTILGDTVPEGMQKLFGVDEEQPEEDPNDVRRDLNQKAPTKRRKKGL